MFINGGGVLSWYSSGLVNKRLQNLGSTPDVVARYVSLGKILNAISHAKQSTRCGMVQPDKRHANRTASVLEWYDRHRAKYNIWFKRR